MSRAGLAALALLALIPSRGTAQSYVGSDTCVECHQEAAEAWRGSHHDLAWTELSDGHARADFDGTSFTLDGMTARFRIEDGVPHALVTEKDGTITDHPVHSVVGIAPLQQYLIETEPGKQQSFDVVWDTETESWYHLYPDQDLPPDDGLHWTGPYKNWNARCAECHATGYSRNYDIETRTYSPVQAEIGVGCEACHGPGSRHLDWAQGDRAETPEAYGFSVAFGPDRQAGIETCAACHSRREAHQDGNPLPGTAYHDAYNLALLRPGLYHPDGQILDEVYVYGSFLQSKMYERGVGCSDCHDAHSATLKAEGNAVCTTCHAPAGNADFPTLRRVLYDDPSHTHHPVGSAGAQCVSCHMIERDYMGIDGRRDHSFRVPRPDVGAATGSPDACTDCHSDESQDWAAARIAEWFPDSDHRGPHYGQVLSRGRADARAASGDLVTLARDPAQPGIVRATAIYLMAQTPVPDALDAAAGLARDPDPLVRAAVPGLLRALPPAERGRALLPLLTDPARNVRIEAAKATLDMSPQVVTRSITAAADVARADWQSALGARLDFPETHLVIGGTALTLRSFPAARQAFREAVRLDPQRADAWSLIVRLTEALDGRAAARAALNEALAAAGPHPVLLDLDSALSR